MTCHAYPIDASLQWSIQTQESPLRRAALADRAFPHPLLLKSGSRRRLASHIQAHPHQHTYRLR